MDLAMLWSPARWGLRVRSALTAAGVVAVVVLFGGIVMMAMLYRSLYGSVDSFAVARVGEITGRLRTTPVAGLDPGLLSTAGRIEAVRVLDSTGAVLLESPESAGLGRMTLPSGTVTGWEAPGDNDMRVSARQVTGPDGQLTVLAVVSGEPVEDALHEVAIALALGGPLVVLAAAAATYGLVGRSLRSVEEIRARVAEIGAGELSQRVPVPPSRDEIAGLATTMNEMLVRIEAAHRAQQRFLSDASHELRSPLATLRAGLDLAVSHPEAADEQLFTGALLPEAIRMQQLIEDLLTLAAADERGMTLRRTDVDLDDIAATVVAAVRGRRGLRIGTRLPPVRSIGDPHALTRLLRNLLDNAITHANKRILVSLIESSDHVDFVVDDDGPGVPVAQRDRILERFVRLQDDRSRDSGGTGLGLAIAAEIVAAHHGRIHVEDSPLGGARLRVRLPLAP
ncbi:sensor histidine kinase [Nocardia sp. alder85J]|uniref:sensor histidine kinase n=1 Tax=Nocardia sp. alder85J TaxID=2862949 RepID=UPI00225AA24E|nr:ATP-binding protein [Nocardia sp. alder85J]MCX4091948.1 ATP-binding protein [Nocardia sp. alder85J]